MLEGGDRRNRAMEAERQLRGAFPANRVPESVATERERSGLFTICQPKVGAHNPDTGCRCCSSLQESVERPCPLSQLTPEVGGKPLQFSGLLWQRGGRRMPDRFLPGLV